MVETRDPDGHVRGNWPLTPFAISSAVMLNLPYLTTPGESGVNDLTSNDILKKMDSDDLGTDLRMCLQCAL